MLSLPGPSQEQGDVEATLARVSAYPGVLGCAVVGTGPRPQLLRTTLDPAAADELVRVAPSLAELCRAAVRELDPQNDLEIVRLRTTKQREIMLVYNEAYLVVALQDAGQQQQQHA